MLNFKRNRLCLSILAAFFFVIFLFTTPPDFPKNTQIFDSKILSKINYTFDRFYWGPEVQGWPPTNSRYMPDYLGQAPSKSLLDTKCLKLDNVDLLIMVQSNPAAEARRNANRRTWMAKAVPGVKTLFIFGTAAADSAEAAVENMDALVSEQTTHCDMVQMDFVDAYYNGTFDSVMALRFAVTAFVGKKPKFMFLGDDDAYVNVPELWRRLFEDKDPPIKPDSNYLLGSVHSAASSKRVHFPEWNNYLKPYIWFDIWTLCPSYMYNQYYYPTYLNGGGYIIPYHLVPCMHNMSMELPYFHINDVFVTGFVRELCEAGVREETELGYDFGGDLERLNPALLLFHHADEEMKMVIHQNLTAT